MQRFVEMKRTDGKREFVDGNGITAIYDPEVCTPKHFLAETGIDVSSLNPLGEGAKEIDNGTLKVSLKTRHVSIEDIATGELVTVFFGRNFRTIRTFITRDGQLFETKTFRNR